MKKEYAKYGNIGMQKGAVLDAEIRNKEKMKNHVRNDKGTFDRGLEWYNNGLSLEEAPDELRSDINFVNGFNKAKRIKNINDDLEALGREWFDSGADLSQAPASYVNNPYFKDGYEKAKSNSDGRKL